MGLRSLLRNLTKLVIMGIGGVLGALVVVWASANSDWATVRLPAVMVPGSDQPIEYEARVYGLVALSFSAGVMASFWIALTIWVRSARRERRLARALERLEAQVAETRGLHIPISDHSLLGDKNYEPSFEDFEELDQESLPGLLSDSTRLPEGYDDPPDDGFDDEEGAHDQTGESEERDSNGGAEERERG